MISKSRKVGWYWAIYSKSNNLKSIIYFDGYSYWEIGSSVSHRENYWDQILDKIEEPEEIR